MTRRKISLICIDSGGGHRAAANALTEVIYQQQRPWDLQLISIQDLLDPIDFIRKSTGVPFEEVYNIMLRRGWTAGTAQLIPVMHGLIRASHDSQVRLLQDYWRANRPDMVVSLIPHYNRALHESLERAWPGTPYVTVLTDIADYPPHFWIEAIDQWVICGSDRAVQQASRIGVPDNRILRTSGMVVAPRFYSSLNIDRESERTSRGLRAGTPVALMLFGGEGSAAMVKIAKALDRSDVDVQLIAVCGRNTAVEAELRAMPHRMPMFVEGFTREIPLLMEISDLFIGKPGPGSLSEAFIKKLPVIVERNAWTMAQEMYNNECVEQLGAGIVVESLVREAAGAVRTVLAPHRYPEFRARAAATRNLAVFEIPEMLDGILEGVSAPGTCPVFGSAAQSLPDSARSV